MALSQLRAVTGKRFRPDLTGSIRARASMLPALYSKKDDQKYQQDTLGLEQKKIDQAKEVADREFDLGQQRLGLMNEEMDNARQREKRANRLALSNLGLTAGLGIAQYDPNVQDIFSGKDASNLQPFSVQELPTDGPPSVDSFNPSWADKAGKGALDAATSITPYAMGLTGAGLGSALGEKVLPFGQKENRIVGGALAGAGLSGLVSGDPYSAAIGGLIGSLGGLF